MTTYDTPEWITTTDGNDLYRTDRRVAVHRGSAPPLLSAAAMGEFLYTMVDLGVAIFFFVGTITLLCVGAGLSVIWVGVPILAFGLLFARSGGAVQRTLARTLLGQPVVGPAGIRTRRDGVAGKFLGIFTDGASWRAVLYHCLKIVLAPFTFAVSLAFYAYGLGAISYPAWRWTLPAQQAADGSWHRGNQLWNGVFIDTLPRMLVQAVIGLALLYLAPKVVRALTTVDRVLIGTLLAGRNDTLGGR